MLSTKTLLLVVATSVCVQCSGAGCSNHNTDTENPSVIVFVERAPEGSFPDPASCAKYSWKAATQQICVYTKACDFENNPPPTEVCYTQEDAKMDIIVYRQQKQLTNRCFDFTQHEVHAEWITIEHPSGGNNDPAPSKKKLGAGPIFGIVLAALITLGVAAYAAYWFVTKRHLNPFGSGSYAPFNSGSTSSSARSSSMVASAGYQQAPMDKA